MSQYTAALTMLKKEPFVQKWKQSHPVVWARSRSSTSLFAVQLPIKTLFQFLLEPFDFYKNVETENSANFKNTLINTAQAESQPDIYYFNIF